MWLTVRTGINDPELVFGSHSDPPVMSEFVVLKNANSMDSILADKVLKKTVHEKIDDLVDVVRLHDE